MKFDITYSVQGFNYMISDTEDSARYIESFRFDGVYLEYESKIEKGKETSPAVDKLICKLLENEYVLLANFIVTTGLNKDFSFVPAAAENKDKTFEYIKISVSLDSVSNKIMLSGYKSWLKHEEIYKKVMLFMDTLRYISVKCRKQD